MGCSWGHSPGQGHWWHPHRAGAGAPWQCQPRVSTKRTPGSPCAPQNPGHPHVPTTPLSAGQSPQAVFVLSSQRKFPAQALMDNSSNKAQEGLAPSEATSRARGQNLECHRCARPVSSVSCVLLGAASTLPPPRATRGREGGKEYLPSAQPPPGLSGCLLDPPASRSCGTERGDYCSWESTAPTGQRGSEDLHG